MPTPDGLTTKWVHYKKLQEQGIPEDWDKLHKEVEDALTPIPLPGIVMPSVEAFYKVRSIKGDITPITFGELKEYIRLYNHKLEPWEIDAVIAYDKQFREVIQGE